VVEDRRGEEKVMGSNSSRKQKVTTNIGQSKQYIKAHISKQLEMVKGNRK